MNTLRPIYVSGLKANTQIINYVFSKFLIDLKQLAEDEGVDIDDAYNANYNSYYYYTLDNAMSKSLFYSI